MNILVCTMGTTWAVLPESVAFVWPNWVDLYADHPSAAAIEQARTLPGGSRLVRPDEIWLVTTEGERARDSLRKAARWWQHLDAPVPLRAWTAGRTEELATPEECTRMTELILRLVLRASERADGGQVVLSLAGGRKTMSSDLQHAADVFGCTALMHVVATNNAPRLDDPLDCVRPLSLPQGEITPIVVRARRRSELLDIEDGTRGRVAEERFPLPDPPPLDTPEAVAVFAPPATSAPTLQDAVARREQQPIEFLGRYLDQLRRHESHGSWRSLYHLPPAQIARLRKTRLGPQHRDWLFELPRAELHCHLGGFLTLAQQRNVARTAWDGATSVERKAAEVALQQTRAKAEAGEQWLANWSCGHAKTRASAVRTLEAAWLLLHLDEDLLLRELFESTEPRFALKATHRDGFSAFERPGELSGSALLQTEAAVGEYARQAVSSAEDQGLQYLELRCSPAKYLGGDGYRFVEIFVAALEKARTEARGELLIRLIWSLDRRATADLHASVSTAVRAAGASKGFVVALDLAGDETLGKAENFADAFRPAFEACLPLTIHAGETADAESIWQATYALHADRIGHGLRLPENPGLAKRLRNRRICLELCPTSNLEVVGFRDPTRLESSEYPAYPLSTLLGLGMAVAICTDNPGISRTTQADEYLAAARLTEGGLTLWQTLTLTRLSFEHAFLPTDERDALLKQADARVRRCAEGI